MRITFQGLGWKSKLTQKRATLSISISKVVVLGSGVKKGQQLYSYLAHDNDNRNMIITYLDGKERFKYGVQHHKEG